MSDLIDRQMAIAYACSGLVRRMDDGDWRRVEDVRRDLKTMPSAQPEITLEQIEEYCRPRCLSIITNDMLWHLEQRRPKRTGEWISCTQKLPKEDEYVLICFEDDPKEKWYCRMAVGWLEDGFWQCWDDRANTRKDVVAWMPLPEPYKGGDEE